MESEIHLENIKEGHLAAQDFKNLRQLCTISSEQNYIGQSIKPCLLDVFTRFVKQRAQQHDQSLDNFFLQFLANLVTNNPANSVQNSLVSTNNFLFCQQIVYFQLINKLQNLEEVDQCLDSLAKNVKHSKFLMVFFYNCTFQLKGMDSHKVQDALSKPAYKCILRAILKAMVTHRQSEEIVQWSALVFMILFNSAEKLGSGRSTIQLLLSSIQYDLSCQAQLLHFVTLLSQKLINSKCTSTLVSGCVPKSSEIKEMYSKGYEFKFLFSTSDINYICQRYHSIIKQFQQCLVIAFSSEKPQQQTVEKVNNLLQLINQIHLFLCQITFLGGYNFSVQTLVQPVLPSLCRFLQLMYLMYKLSGGGVAKNTHYSIEAPSLQKFNQLLGLQADLGSIKQFYSLLYTVEQFASVLRLMSNLIHINPQIQSFFEQRFEYLYIVMSLTNLDEQHQTMHEWSLIFIRNVCQVSQNLRQRISALKVAVKSE